MALRKTCLTALTADVIAAQIEIKPISLVKRTTCVSAFMLNRTRFWRQQDSESPSLEAVCTRPYDRASAARRKCSKRRSALFIISTNGIRTPKMMLSRLLNRKLSTRSYWFVFLVEFTDSTFQILILIGQYRRRPQPTLAWISTAHSTCDQIGDQAGGPLIRALCRCVGLECCGSNDW